MQIGYMRVSKTDGLQSTDLQRDALGYRWRRYALALRGPRLWSARRAART